jgi:hypothetical protein
MRVRLPIERICELARDQAFLEAVENLYRELDRRIAVRRPVCANRGLCCSFGTFGHQLFVTPVELSYFVAGVGPPPLGSEGKCPYQAGGVCTVRAARPAGCRIFFCEAASQSWQPDETEDTLRRIKQIHVRFDLPYAYVEWLDALRQLSGDWPAGPACPFDRGGLPAYDPPLE